MKSLVIASMLMAAVIAGSLLYGAGLEKSSQELSEMNMSIQQSLDGGDMKGAEAAVGRMKAYINGREEIMSVMGDHKELHEIKESLAELERFTKGGNRVDAQAKSELLSLMIEHLPENNRLRLRNIL